MCIKQFIIFRQIMYHCLVSVPVTTPCVIIPKHWKNYPFSYQQKTKVGSKYELHFMDISGARIFHPLTSSPPDSNLPQRTSPPRQLQTPKNFNTRQLDNFNPQRQLKRQTTSTSTPRQLQLQTTPPPRQLRSLIDYFNPKRLQLQATLPLGNFNPVKTPGVKLPGTNLRG